MSTSSEQRTLRIGWLIFPPIIGSGGYHNIFRIANLLASFGHENVFFMDQRTLHPDYRHQPEQFIRRFFGPVFGTVQPWPHVIEHVDVALATQHDTFEMLERCAPGVTRGYFVQDFEPFFHSMGYQYLKAEATYRAGVPCITLGHWLGTFLREQYGATTYPFDFAVDHHLYYPRPELRPERPRVIFYARPSTPRRCFDLGVAALAIVHQRHPEVEIVLFGDHGLGQQTLPFPFSDYGILNHESLAQLYASATIGLVLSTTNPSLMPPELMASRCAVVDLQLPPNHFLIEHSRTGLLANSNPQAVAAALCQLLEDLAERERLVRAAEEHVQQFSWEHSARQVEAALLTIAPGKSTTRAPLQVDLEHIIGEGQTPSLGPALVVGQRCVLRHDGLSGIDVALGSTGREQPTLRLYEGISANQPLIEMPPSAIKDGWASYRFGPVPAIRHRPIYFTLSADDGPQLLFDYQPSGGGSLAYNHVPQPGQLLFRTFYRPASQAVPSSVEMLSAEVDYLAAVRALAAEEQQLLNAYLDKVQQHQHVASRGVGWRDRVGRAIHVAQQAMSPTIIQPVRKFIVWARTR